MKTVGYASQVDRVAAVMHWLSARRTPTPSYRLEPPPGDAEAYAVFDGIPAVEREAWRAFARRTLEGE